MGGVFGATPSANRARRPRCQIPARRILRIYARQPNRQKVAMRSFDQLLGLLSNIPDPRRAEGKLYKLQHVLLFSILAIVTGGNSYRSIVTFIKVHRRRLNAAFGLHWRRAPAHTSIRYILQGLDPQAVEQIFRQHAAGLQDATTGPSRRSIALDGKTLRRRRAASSNSRTISPRCCKNAKPPVLPSAPSAVTQNSPPVATDMKPGQPTYSAPPVPLPEPSGNLSSNL